MVFEVSCGDKDIRLRSTETQYEENPYDRFKFKSEQVSTLNKAMTLNDLAPMMSITNFNQINAPS